MSLLLLIFVIVLLIQNGRLKDEIDRLKREKINYCPKCGKQLFKQPPKIAQKQNQQYNIPQTNNNLEVRTTKKIVEKPKMTDQEVKNNIILITGSILIVLAAIIYLTSSWSMTSNILKCIVIFILFFVFIFASYLAKNKLKLNQTARAFNYIALAYLPLSLISLSIFGLLGENFSINGMYQDFYLSFALFITSLIYYIEAKNENDKFLSIASVITTILAIIFLVNVFTNSFYIVIIFLYLYSYFLAILYEKKIYIHNENISKIILNIMYYSLLIILSFSILNLLSFTEISTSTILQFIALLILNIGLSLYTDNKILNKGIIPISIVIIFYLFTLIYDFDTILKQLIILSSIPVVYLYNFIVEKKINIFNFILVTFVFTIVFFISLLSFKDISIPIYLVSYLYVLLLGFTYYLSDNLKKAINWLVPICLEFSTILLVAEENLSINILLGLSTLIVVSSLIPKFKGITKELVIIPSILNIMYVLIAYSNKSLITTLLIIVSIITYYLLLLRINKNYKYPLYIAINIVMIYIGHLICNGLNSYTMALSIIIIIALEVIDERLKDNNNFIYILIDYFITAIALTITDKRTAFIMTIIIALVLAAHIFDNKKEKALYNIPLLTPLIYIGTSSVMTFYNFNTMIIIAILLIVGIPLLTIKNKDYSKYVFIPFAYLFILSNMDISLYIPIVLLLFVNIVYYISSNKNIIFKVLIIISTLMLYYRVIYDVGLNLTVFTVGILLLYSLYITRNIIKGDESLSKVIEYFLLIVINFYAITSYTSETDGMIYVVLLLIITIYSYLKKYGPSFLVSIIFILVNMFLLTRMFWLSLPWWIYILGVGIILILFAVLNEINEKSNLKNKFIELKNNLKL